MPLHILKITLYNIECIPLYLLKMDFRLLHKMPLVSTEAAPAYAEHTFVSEEDALVSEECIFISAEDALSSAKKTPLYQQKMPVYLYRRCIFLF